MLCQPEPFLFTPGHIMGQIYKLTPVSQLMEDFLLKFSIIIQPAQSSRLKEHISAGMDSLDQTSQRMFKGSAGIIRAIAAANLYGFLCCLRKQDVCGIKAL